MCFFQEVAIKRLGKIIAPMCITSINIILFITFFLVGRKKSFVLWTII